MPVLRRWGGRSLTGWPSNRMRPSSGVQKPAIMRRSVVLPQPDGPSRKKHSPSWISRDTPSTAVTLPNRLAMNWRERFIKKVRIQNVEMKANNESDQTFTYLGRNLPVAEAGNNG